MSAAAAETIVPGRPRRIAEGVLCVTASNAGMMTGPGTNTYLVGEGTVTAIDPGPADRQHCEALIAAAPGPIERILVTHTHRDHSPGAALLAELTGAETAGMPPPATPENDQGFGPDRRLADGDRIAAGGTSLVAIHTPGHASNHLCYLLEEAKMVFTGDHIMNGSTVVIAPPDGDMRAYLDSLQKLKRYEIETIAPGHGAPLAEPVAVIDWIVAHRLERERKVVEALSRLGPCRIETLLPAVYEDVDERLHAVAKFSLWAHLEKLAAEAAARVDDGVWYALEPTGPGRS